MGILSIKIRIGDRDYPMKVDENEEEVLRTAGRLLNETLKAFKDQYQIEDRQDLLAMVAFDSLVQKIKKENATAVAEQQLTDKLSYLNSLISKSISS